ncbi:MAG: polyprenyl synthetase family protein [Rhodoferax sp.]|uniref:polyprenyl synthetase family protein n=1 Tax=Rhodoferax sp. TaxID=50421 RepID=UPI0026023A5B|nr:farnesyl diphosphate synthase [Rhodoferax sp.]MDD5335985.1 polyprenyl synthetase family protein [Rhodoferax sp.]
MKVDTPFDLGAWSGGHLASVEQALGRWVSANGGAAVDHGAPAELIEAMRYAVLDGGKRLRPLLLLAACESVTGEPPEVAGSGEMLLPAERYTAALRAACAVELIHAYSLVHDDMPCMDNDVLRRGKPTVHVKFGEARALLAGDALQALAFELLTPDAGMPAGLQAQLCRLLARAAGSAGMAGGQAIDLASVGARLSESQLREMHRLKTGALLQASVMMGAAFAELPGAARAALSRYGAAIGLAFQVVDDILDVTADSATLGKTAGKDACQDKPTYVSVLGLERSAAYAQELLEQALTALAQSGLRDTRALRGLANMVVNRCC